MSISNDEVAKLIKKGIPDATVDVKGDGYKYEATVISKSFNDLSTLKRQQAVFATVNDVITSGELHALTIIAKTLEESE